MNEDYKNIIKLAKMLENKQLLETDDLKGFVTDIVNAFAQFRSASQEVNKDTKDTLNLALKQLNQEHDRIFEELQTTKQEAKSDVSEAIKGALTECKNMCDSIMAMRPKDGEPGKDADEEYIIAELLKRIPQMPEIPDMDAFSEQVDGKIQKVYEHIKKSNNGFPGVRALQNLIDVSVSTPTNGQVLAYNTTSSRWENSTAGGGSGTVTSVATAGLISGGTITTTGTITTSMATGKLVGRSTAGTGIMEEITVGSGLTLSGGTLTATGGGTGDVVGPASATDNAVARFDTTTGKLIQNSGVTIDDTNIVSAAGLNLSGLTASQIVATDASKNLQTLTTATYPSLTELSYVKGVTSAIQTQLNAKGAGTVTTVSVATANGFSGSVANATTTPAITITSSVTGLVKGNGSAFSSAIAGADYAVGSPGLAGGQTITGGTLTTENLTLRANAADLTTGAIIVTTTKEASSTTVGSVQLAGGLAVAKRVYALDMTVTNTITGSITGNAGTASAVAVGGITGLGTGVATALAVNVGTAGAFVVNGGALGTPSSGVATNLTGTASGLTAGNVTTNANLTGPITSVGNATSVASQTGTGSTFVMNTSPTIATPVINGTVTGTGVASTATASTLVSRDASGNSVFINSIEGYTSTATAAGTTTLTSASTYTQIFTGSTTQTVVLPTTSIIAGQQYYIVNRSTGLVTVQSSGLNTILILATGTAAIFTANIATPTTAANWDAFYIGVNAASGKVATINNNLTFAGTDATTMTFPSTSATIARTDSANTFTGIQSMTSPAITTSITTPSTSFDAFNTTATTLNLGGAATTLSIGGTPTTAITHNYSTNATAAATTKTVNLGTGGAASSTTNVNIGATAGGTTTINSPTISLGGTTGATTTGTIELGNASDTTISRLSAGQLQVEGVQILTASNTVTVTNKSISASQITTGTFGTGAYTMNTSLTVPQVFNTDVAATVTANAATITRANRNNTFTNSSAAAMTITLSTTGARAGDMLLVQIYDFSAVAQTITWVNTENSTVTVPGTSNGSTTLPLTVGFKWNASTSKWRVLFYS